MLLFDDSRTDEMFKKTNESVSVMNDEPNTTASTAIRRGTQAVAGF